MGHNTIPLQDLLAHHAIALSSFFQQNYIKRKQDQFHWFDQIENSANLLFDLRRYLPISRLWNRQFYFRLSFYYEKDALKDGKLYKQLDCRLRECN